MEGNEGGSGVSVEPEQLEGWREEDYECKDFGCQRHHRVEPKEDLGVVTEPVVFVLPLDGHSRRHQRNERPGQSKVQEPPQSSGKEDSEQVLKVACCLASSCAI